VSARDWSPEERALFLERERQLRDWLQARKEEIKALLLEKPDSVPGYGLKLGRTIETITDPQQVWQRFNRQLGGSLESFLTCIKVGKTKLKEELRALTRHRGTVLEADLEALLAGCVEITRAAASIEAMDTESPVRTPSTHSDEVQQGRGAVGSRAACDRDQRELEHSNARSPSEITE